jgi:hypothetical protein
MVESLAITVLFGAIVRAGAKADLGIDLDEGEDERTKRFMEMVDGHLGEMARQLLSRRYRRLAIVHPRVIDRSK